MRVTAPLLSPLNILSERCQLDSFRSVSCDKFVRTPADPYKLHLDGGPSLRQRHGPPRPILRVAPSGLYPRKPDQQTQEEASQVGEEGTRAGLLGEHILPIFERLHEPTDAE